MNRTRKTLVVLFAALVVALAWVGSDHAVPADQKTQAVDTSARGEETVPCGSQPAAGALDPMAPPPPCLTGYCSANSGYRCVYTGQKCPHGVGCRYALQVDGSCQQPDPLPANACGCS